MVPFVFSGNDIHEVYSQVRSFIRQTEQQFSMRVPQEQVRVTPKHYPDYSTSYTVVEVFIESPSLYQTNEALFADTLDDIYKTSLFPETPEPLGQDSELIMKARALLEQRKEPLVLEYITDEGWRLRSDKTTDLSIVFWGLTSEENILDAVKNHLGIKEEKTAGDDYDPFIDGDDLP